MRSSGGNRIAVKMLGLLLGVFLFIIFYFFNPFNINEAANNTCSIALLMACWWMFEVIPLGITALIPVVFFPILGVIDGKTVASTYFNSTIMLFLGGFIIAIAMEKWELHKRISLKILSLIGGTPSQMILGFMIATAFLSMFISNTATAIMMLPIGIAVIIAMEESTSKAEAKAFSTSLMLAIAYSASVGGLATLVGTPPNLAFHRIFEITFPDAPEISFGKWMLFGLPLSLLLLFILWIILTKFFYRIPKQIKISKNIIKDELKSIGKITIEEKQVLAVFIITGLLWIFRNGLNLGFFEIPGWASLFRFGGFIDDGTVAIFMAVILFILPSKRKKVRLLSAADIKKLPWEIVLLFGGGFALAEGFHSSGLSSIVGSYFRDFSGIPEILVIMMICTIITFLTELTSNTATIQTILPILAGITVSAGMNPLLLMIPATIAASCAFMLPVATPPNAIVFGSGRIEIRDMVRVGIVFNIIGIIMVTLLFYTLGYEVFGIESNALPFWSE
jgi:solute carrier family 13 (sodium-dependent dicarboxylate transporter), member 2/3/5